MFSKEIENKKIIYKDNHNEIEVLINEDPILDVDNKYNLEFYLENKDFLEYIIKDIQDNYKRMYYISKDYNKEFEKIITSHNFKIMTYKVFIPYQKQNKANKLRDINNKCLWEEYMLKNINSLFKENSKYLENESYKEYTKKHLEFIEKHDKCEILTKNNSIIGSICYNVDTDSDYIYIRDIYGNNKKIIKEELEILLSKYQKDIVVDVIYMYKVLIEIIEELNGKIKSVIYAWKGRD